MPRGGLNLMEWREKSVNIIVKCGFFLWVTSKTYTATTGNAIAVSQIRPTWTERQNVVRLKRRDDNADDSVTEVLLSPQAETPKTRLKSCSPFIGSSEEQDQRSAHVLPALCIICGKKDHVFWHFRKKKRDQLALAETHDAGKNAYLNFALMLFNF